VTTPPVDLEQLSTGALLTRYGQILDELQARNVVRSRNAPAGDLAETLAWLVYGGTLAPRSFKSWDLVAADGRTVQVKCRVTDGNTGVFSPFRSEQYAVCVFVLLASDYSVRWAIEVPAGGVSAIARRSEHVNGVRVRISDDLRGLPGALELTDAFRAAAELVDVATTSAPIPTSSAPIRATDMGTGI
jgi:hypothetical protein